MKIIQLFLIFLIFLSSNACKEGIKVVQQKDDDGNLTAEYEVRPKDGAKQGKFTGYYPSGKKFEESTYLNNVLDGNRTLYYESGAVQTKENHVKGTFSGKFQSFYENGQPKEEGEYSNDAMNGEWTFYYPSGKKREIVNFIENEEDGPFKEFYENGNIKTEGQYKEGDNEVGLLKKYNQSGKLIEKMDCEMKQIGNDFFSQCKSVWKDSSKEI